MIEHEVPEALRLALEQSQHEQSPEQQAAWQRFILGRSTLAECFEARRKSNSNGARP
jgi:hypothetical protein